MTPLRHPDGGEAAGGPAFVSRRYFGTAEKQVLRSLRSHQDDEA